MKTSSLIWVGVLSAAITGAAWAADAPAKAKVCPAGPGCGLGPGAACGRGPAFQGGKGAGQGGGKQLGKPAAQGKRGEKAAGQKPGCGLGPGAGCGKGPMWCRRGEA